MPCGATMTKKKKPEIEWLTYWRVIDGDVVKSMGFMRDDCVYFDIDPETHQTPVDEENDPRVVHVDDIYEQNGVFELEDEADARAYAIKFMNDKIFEYQLKLARLHGTNTLKG